MGAQQFLNSLYKRQKNAKNDQGKYVTVSRDALIFTLKDVETNETSLKIIPEPTIDFYTAVESQGYPHISIPESKAIKHTVPYKDRDKAIATTLGLINEYYESWKHGNNWQFNQSLRSHPQLYSADVDIEDFYKTRCILKHGSVFGKAHKGFADIEVDTSEYDEEFPHPDIAPCPIYLITYIDRHSRTVYSYILYDERVSGEIQTIMGDIGGFVQKNIDPVMLKEDFAYKFNVYRTELELITAFFSTIHECKPDIVGWWNMSFDMPTIINRLKRLGCTDSAIADIMCHPEVPKEFRYVKYVPDPKRAEINTASTDEDEDDENAIQKITTKARPHPSRLIDWIEVPGYTQFIDQLATFSCLRKRSILPSYKLDDIGRKYAGIGKVDLKELGYSIKNVNIKNFTVCLAYNIRDSYVQYLVEEKQQDINQMIVSSFNTRLSKTFSNSIVIKNYLMQYLIIDEHHIMGNAFMYPGKEGFKGALVGKPELIEQLGVPVMGKPSRVFENVIDADASSMYPAMIISHNIFKSALFGHVKNVIRGDGVNMGKGDDLFMDLQTIDQSIFSIAHTYLNLPTPYDILKDIEKIALSKAEEKYGLPR